MALKRKKVNQKETRNPTIFSGPNKKSSQKGQLQLVPDGANGSADNNKKDILGESVKGKQKGNLRAPKLRYKI